MDIVPNLTGTSIFGCVLAMSNRAFSYTWNQGTKQLVGGGKGNDYTFFFSLKQWPFIIFNC